MAYEETLRNVSLDADSSLATYTGVPGLPGSASPNSGFQFRFVKVTGAHQVGLATGAANEVIVGVMQNKPQATGQAATVAVRGITMLQAGGTVAAGNIIKTDANGQGLAGTPGTDTPVGIAIGAAASGQLFPCLLIGRG
jgi:hypothetical protein